MTTFHIQHIKIAFFFCWKGGGEIMTYTFESPRAFEFIFGFSLFITNISPNKNK